MMELEREMSSGVPCYERDLGIGPAAVPFALPHFDPTTLGSVPCSAGR